MSISPGDIVNWVSEGGYHDVNFNINSITGESFGNPEEIASASLPVQPGAGEMGSITFNEVGVYNYDCSVGSHAQNGMTGVISILYLKLTFPLVDLLSSLQVQKYLKGIDVFVVNCNVNLSLF